ncbi:C39 family peptidase [filamentous cyanobacterium LEGE 11480]|uniref:C39 family peptidase n=1 Tax=Romeriopsis navalis LEGE 11480 TaxID=2777977 RepID=A0A928VKF2_9CYAN|nr:C39 family peptidase [Romeriopsis navalis]MBE9029277.1 C39 family peptidase [Romeriopsis navalis LEGE 11480]
MTAVDSLALPLPPDYAQAIPVVVAQALQLKGAYDAQSIAKLQLTTDSGARLPIDYQSGNWQLVWSSGWTTVGAHWLQMQGYGPAGVVIETQFFYFIVCPDLTTASTSLRLRVLQDTWFKATAQDSTQLAPSKKVRLRAGEVFDVLCYGLAPAHCRLVLTQPIAPIGNFGYVDITATELLQGDQIYQLSPVDVRVTEIAGGQLLVKRTTYLKSRLADSTHLALTQKQQLVQGQLLPLHQYARCDDHWQVTLPNTDLPAPAFIAAADVNLRSLDTIVDVAATELSCEILQTMPLKQRPVAPDHLSLTEKVSLAAGSMHCLSHYAAVGPQLQIRLRSAPVAQTGYLDRALVQLRRGTQVLHPGSEQVELGLSIRRCEQPPDQDWPLLNIRSVSAILQYLQIGAKTQLPLADELLQWCFEHYGAGSQTDRTCLQGLLQAYGIQLESRSTWTSEQLRASLSQGVPILLFGRFTPAAHCIVLVGYGPSGWLVCDPWGDATTGYRCLDGSPVWYAKDYFTAMVGVDGAIVADAVSQDTLGSRESC